MDSNETEVNLTRVELNQLLLEYHPFIKNMIKKVQGTAIELKWQMIYDSLVKPEKKLTMQKLKNVRNILERFKSRDNFEENENLALQVDLLEDESMLFREDVGQEQKSEHDSMCEHSYAKSVTSEMKVVKPEYCPDENCGQNDSETFIADAFVNQIRGKLPTENEAHITLKELSQETTPKSTQHCLSPNRRSFFLKRLETGFKNLESGLNSETNQSEVVTPDKIPRKKKRAASATKIKLPKRQRSETRPENQKKLNADEPNKNRNYFEDVPIIFDQTCIAPLDLELWTYKTISRVSFAKSKRGFMYKCFSFGCSFQTLVQDALEEHLQTKHKSQTWNGYCAVCVNMCLVQQQEKTILDEFEHMKAHIKSIRNSSPIKVSATEAMKPPVTDKLSAVSLQSHPSMKSVMNLPLGTTIKTVQLKTTNSQSQIISRDNRTFQQSTTISYSPSLRPWLKTTISSSEFDMSTEALSAFYKSMSCVCGFFSNDKSLFLKHLEHHAKPTTNDVTNFLNCCYCDFIGISPSDLLNHLEIEHTFDHYQCSFCFYRSNAFNVLTHQRLHHKSKPSKVVKCENLKDLNIRAELEKMKKRRLENVPPIICVFCRALFTVMEPFIKHLKTHDENQKVRCIKCGDKTSSRHLHEHLEKCHSMGMYQCVYCFFGTENSEVLNHHVAKEHPSKIPLFCERVWQKNGENSTKKLSPSVIESICTKSFETDVDRKNLWQKSNDTFLMRNETKVGKLKADRREEIKSNHKFDENVANTVKRNDEINSAQKPSSKIINSLSSLLKPLQM